MEDCVFCQIVAEKIPCSLVKRTAFNYIFMDIRPMNPGHLLIVPSTHVEKISDFSSVTASDMFDNAKMISESLKMSLSCTGVNLWMSEGKDAGQVVPHMHMHVVPRYADDGIRFRNPNGNMTPDRSKLEDLATKIKAALPY